jgi:hypothetical protein
MAIYRQAKAGETDLEKKSIALLDTGELAVMPVIYVDDFDIRVPGAAVVRYGTVVDVVDLGHVRVQWVPSGEEQIVSVSELSFVEYATVASELEELLCPHCENRHHPNVRCRGEG